MADLTDLTPARWFAYVDARLAAGIRPATLNAELAYLLGWLRFLQEQGRAVCPQMFKVDKLDEAQRLPRDVPIEQLRRLQQAIQAEATSPRPNVVRIGRMDLAWFLLMLHSGLRMGEVRRLKLSEIDWEHRRVRIEQSKGLKDRLVPLSTPTTAGAKGLSGCARPGKPPARPGVHLPSGATRRELLRPPAARILRKAVRRVHFAASIAPFLRHLAAQRRRADPHRAGHSGPHSTLTPRSATPGCMTAPSPPTTIAAMAQVEGRLTLPEDAVAAPPTHGELLALVDSLRSGTLNDTQADAVRRIRIGIMALAEQSG